MYIDYTDSQKALRRELRAYFSTLMTPELREGTRGRYQRAAAIPFHFSQGRADRWPSVPDCT